MCNNASHDTIIKSVILPHTHTDEAHILILIMSARTSVRRSSSSLWNRCCVSDT